MSDKKVVQINSYKSIGGASIACLRLNDALNNNNVKSRLFNYDLLSMFYKKRMTFNLLLEKGLFYFHQSSKKYRFKFSNPLFGIDISDYKEITNADIIHLHWINNGFLSLNSLEKIASLNKPIVWTLHDMWAFTGGCSYSEDCDYYKSSCGNCFYLKNPGAKDLSNKIHKRKKNAFEKLNKNLHLVTCSSWLEDKARKSSLFRNINIRTIPNPIDINVYKPLPQIEARQQLKLPKDKFLILFVALNVSDERKGVDYISQALKILLVDQHSIIDNIELVILGNKKNIETLSFPCKYTLAGYISDEKSMCNYFCASNVFITPSLEDNLPNTVMESLSCGTPVLAFNTGGIPDMVDHKKNGYLAEYKSAKDLANGIVWMYENRNNQELKENARKKVLDNYTYKIVARKYDQLYETILKDKL